MSKYDFTNQKENNNEPDITFCAVSRTHKWISGEIKFEGYDDIKREQNPKYVIMDKKTKAEDVLTFLREEWKLKIPNYIISITGSAKNLSLDTRVKGVFQRGLLNVIKCADPWIVTGGTHTGVMKHVGEIIRDHSFQRSSTEPLVSIGIATFCMLDQAKNLKEKDRKNPVGYKIQKDDKTYLDPYHTHFILVEDDEQEVYGKEIDFRARLEKELKTQTTGVINGTTEDCTQSLVVQLVVQGGKNTLVTVKKSIDNDIPVVFISGTGEVANAFEYAYQNQEDINGNNPDLQRHKMDEIKEHLKKVRGIKNDNDVEDFAKDMEAIIREKSHMITIHKFTHSFGRSRDIDVAILKSLLKVNTPKCAQLKLALHFNQPEFARTRLSIRNDDWERNQNLMNVLLKIALLEDKVEFVDMFLDVAPLEKFLDDERLSSLFKCGRNNTFNTLMMKKYPGFAKLDGIDSLIGWYLRDGRLCKSITLLVELIRVQNSSPYFKLLLWSILMNQQEMAKLFWRKGQDKTASALMAYGILNSMASKTNDRNAARLFSESATVFRELAIDMLNECFDSDETETYKLLQNGIRCWGKTTCLDLAAETNNRYFLSQTACLMLLDKLWLGNLSTDSITSQEDPDIKRKAFCQNFQGFFEAPIVVYIENVISHFLLLALFSYILLNNMTTTITPWDCLLIGWTITILIEEFRQIKSLPYSDLTGKVQRYWASIWNKMDMTALFTYVLGMILRFQNLPGAMDAARIFLGVSLLIVFIRTLHMFTVNKEMGPKLVMIMYMFVDLVFFFVIMLVFITGYAITSHSILYPNTNFFNTHTILKLFKNAYWNLYGELALDEYYDMEPSCTFDPSLYYNNTLPRCPSVVGSYVGPIMLGFYVLFANVLMINLLIAMFSNTFQKVQDQADLHWCYLRYFFIEEYRNRPILPPPLIIINHMIWTVRWIKECTCYPDDNDNENNARSKYIESNTKNWENVLCKNYLDTKENKAKFSLDNQMKQIHERIEELGRRFDEWTFNPNKRTSAGDLLTEHQKLKDIKKGESFETLVPTQ